MEEEWRPIPGYEGLYEVSNTGLIRSVERIITYVDGRKHRYESVVKKPYIAHNGYYNVGLDSKGKHLTIHRCVATAFIDNPNGLKVVNHKDGNKLNNNVDNLEWTTSSENNKHAFKIGLKSNPTRPVRCLETGMIFNSVTDAANHLNGNRNNLSTAIKKGWKFNGYHFEYVNK